MNAHETRYEKWIDRLTKRMKDGNLSRPRRRGPFIGLAAVLIWLMAGSSGAAFEASHDLAVTLLPEQARLMGTDRITLTDCPRSGLVIGLHPRTRVISSHVNGASREILRTEEGLALPLAEGECETPVELTIRYEGHFQDKAPELPINTDNPGYGVSGTIGPRGTLLLGGAGWYPAIRGAVERIHLQVTAPPGVSAVTAGRALGVQTTDDRTLSRWQIDPPAGRIALSAGDYVITSSSAGDIPIATYFLSGDRSLADTYLKATAEYLALYEDRFGPYPFPKFAIVENFFPTGYGFPSYTLIGGRVLRLPFIVQTSLGHEIAHCWWGNGVQVDPSDGNWSEGLTSYVAEHLYQEMSSVEAGRRHRQQLLRNYATIVAPEEDFPLRRFSHRYSPLTQTVGYDKSAMVFHMLRQRIGDAAFWEGLRRLYHDRRHQTANWRDLQRTFESSGGQKLSWFFHQWLDRPGAPFLWLEDVRSRRAGTGSYMVEGVLHQNAPYYRLEVPLNVSGGPSGTAVSVAIDGPSAPFRVTLDRPPQRLEGDPRSDVFRRLAPQEIPPAINALKRRAPLVVVVPTAPVSPAQRQTADVLALALGRSAVDFRIENDLDFDGTPSEDWLFLGLPTHPQLRSMVARDVRLDPATIAVEGQTFDARQASFFGVWRHPGAEGRVLAVLTPGPEEALPTIARKIPHYGRYSYLVFEGTENRIKGTWPAASSPLVHTWPADQG